MATLRLDCADPINGKMFLIAVYAYSKRMEVEIVNSATSQATIECLRMIFSRFGLPEMMVTDNGTYFTSSEFQEFAQHNSIRHIHIAPYHPSSNGLAERAVQTFKLGIRKQLNGTLPLLEDMLITFIPIKVIVRIFHHMKKRMMCQFL